ncbi:MAG: serine hydrolase domain-containing protein [Bacillota bacterium]|nr:serine hydrolase domain-containing protein [Bacillota bacterium]
MTEPRKNLIERRKRRKLKRFWRRFILLVLVVVVTSLCYRYYNLKHTYTKTNKIKHITKIKKSLSKKSLIEPVVDINRSPVIDAYLKGLHFNGSVIVVKNDKIILNKGYGFADFEKKRVNNSQTDFYIGSITKVFISTSIMQLQEKGKLNINDLLSKYIPEFPGGNKIKLFNLLTHTSGIPEHSESQQMISHDDLMKKIEGGHLKFQPGTKWNYSDSNYSILAYIVEKITGQPLDRYVKEHIFNIAGMKHTGFGTEIYHEPFYPKGYKIKDNRMISTTLPNMSQLFGCGDIYSTPYDMYLFDKNLYSGKFFSKKSLITFLTPFKNNYALGLYRDPGSYSDHGVLPGWNSLNSFSKKGTVYTVLLSNVQNGVKSLGTLNNQIYIMLRDMKY